MSLNNHAKLLEVGGYYLHGEDTWQRTPWGMKYIGNDIDKPITTPHHKDIYEKVEDARHIDV